jgi:signal transduction histidine kinase
MESGSLRFRLIALWAVFLVFTIQAASFGLQTLFEHSIKRRTVDELTVDLQLLAEALTLDDQGSVRLLTAPADPLFAVAYSGRYWQISRDGEALLRSPSLWDFKLAVDARGSPANSVEQERYEGPDNQSLLAMVRTVSVGKPGQGNNLNVVAAVDYRELERASQRFSGDLTIGLAGLAALLLLAASAHVIIGLRPLRDIQARLSRVRSGDIRRLEGAFPKEVMPLVAETNALLDAQDAALDAARTHAGNLAHGLKTPLAVMTAQARTLRRKGECAVAGQIENQIEVMRRHVERELARARARGGGRTHHRRINTATAIQELVETFKLLPKGQALEWDLDVWDPLMLALDRTDFHEIMGNLIDNAHKWARTKVRVQGRLVGQSAVFVIEDDGPGVAPEDLARIVERGVRADATVPGSGLGLAIASDVVAAYKGRLDLTASKLGGLSVVITLPDRNA